MSTLPARPESSARVEGEGAESDPRRAGAYRFWRNFAQANDTECREALQFLAEIRGEDYSGLQYSETSSPESKYVKVDLPVTSPKNAKDAWNSDRVTSLIRVDPQVHCLAIDGDDRKYDGGDYFVGCASSHPSSIGPDACTVGTHSKPGRIRIELSGPAFMVKVRASSAATKPKVLAGVMLLEERVPSAAWECGLADALTEYVAVPRVWKWVLELYPGPDTIWRYMNGDDESARGTVTQGASRPEADPGAQVPRQVDLQSVRSRIGMPSDSSLLDDAPSLPPGRLEPFAQAYRRNAARDTFASDDSVPSVMRWWERADHASLPGDQSNWWAALKQVEVKGRVELNKKVRALNEAIETGDKWVERAIRGISEEALVAKRIAQGAEKHIGDLGDRMESFVTEMLEEMESRLTGGGSTLGGPGAGLRVDTATTPVHRTEPGWGELPEATQEDIIQGIMNKLDMKLLAAGVASELNLGGVKADLSGLMGRVSRVENEFSSEQGSVAMLKTEVATWEARRNASSSE